MRTPFVIEGAINGPSFRAYMTRCLAPTLCPGDFVVMDGHGRPGSRAATPK